MLDIKLFLTHFFCYWIMVLIYDNDISSRELDIAISSSIKNQLFYTLLLLYIIFI